MAIREARRKTLWFGLIGWLSALIMFFPIFWMFLAAFKTEIDAVGPPQLIFVPTIENFGEVNSRADYLAYALNSILESLGATLVCLVLSIPARLVNR